MHHYLKIHPPFYSAVIDGDKTFEIRKNDRGYQKGDSVTLSEYDPDLWDKDNQVYGCYTGNYVVAVITYVTNYEQRSGFIVFGFRLATETKD
jgi:hypothetical protein